MLIHGLAVTIDSVPNAGSREWDETKYLFDRGAYQVLAPM